jgi:hypothetical protein
VRRHLLDLIVLFFFVTIVCVYIVLAQPSIRDTTVRVYVFVVGGLLMLAIVAAAGDALPRRRVSDFDRALAAGPMPDKPLPELEKLNREVTLATASAYDLHFRLLPHLREIAQCRLERNGHTASPETLGRWWELLRPDRPAPEDRFAPGITQADLRALIADLDRM